MDNVSFHHSEKLEQMCFALPATLQHTGHEAIDLVSKG